MAGGASAAEMADTIGKEIRFVIPEDALVPKSINSGVPGVIMDPRSRFARGVKDIVDALVGRTVVQPVRGRRLKLGRG
jgi:MinD-like ATPase involved in chromosome partitioning or flagellar assembly